MVEVLHQGITVLAAVAVAVALTAQQELVQ
jgi:hypothetical protein